MPEPLEKQEEIDLARRMIDGDQDAFENFVEHFQRKIFHYSWLMCGQREDAEEVAQETLLKVFTKLGQLDNAEHVRPWVFRIARNECLMMRRKSLFAPARELSLDDLLPKAAEIADWSTLPEEGVLRDELHREIELAIQALPEIYKTVILLRDLEQLSTEETAGILDISADSVKTRLHRGRLALRQALDAYLRQKDAVA